MDKKTCFKCSLEKEAHLFYKRPAMKDGRLNKCIDCCRSEAIKNRCDNRQYYLEYDKRRYQTPERMAYSRKQSREFKKNNPALVAQYTRDYRKNNPEKYLAHRIVNNAIRRGEMKKQPCVQCGDKSAQAHHHDYSMPLMVTWLCAKHHTLQHAKG